AFEKRILLVAAERSKCLVAALLCKAFDASQGRAILLRRVLLRLRTLLVESLDERALLVKPLTMTVAAIELAVDEHGATGILPAGRSGIGRNDPINDRLERRGFLRTEEFPALRCRWQFPAGRRGVERNAP